jgi:CVNH domain
MKIGSAATAALLLAVTAWPVAAQAQGVPRGSYLRSCQDIRVRGDTLLAVCRTVDGRGQRTNLPQVSRCVGDIGNNNGNLQCNYADGGPPPYGQAPPQPGYGYGPPR